MVNVHSVDCYCLLLLAFNYIFMYVCVSINYFCATTEKCRAKARTSYITATWLLNHCH